ncbi:MAG: helix-turn-helix transcriptional regulator [Streptosporangiaceae bacterium]
MNRPRSKLESPTPYGPGEAQTEIQNRWATDKLISVREIRELFAIGRTAAYELTHRPGFPEPIKLSPRCYRWWASEVTAFAASVRRDSATPKRFNNAPRSASQRPQSEGTPPLRITGRTRFARTRKGVQE